MKILLQEYVVCDMYNVVMHRVCIIGNEAEDIIFGNLNSKSLLLLLLLLLLIGHQARPCRGPKRKGRCFKCGSREQIRPYGLY